jgi:hypothetical protein
MKIALHPETQASITAFEEAPDQALCPHCEGNVLLRSRKRMSGNRTYYWRHQDNHNRACDGRSRSVNP